MKTFLLSCAIACFATNVSAQIPTEVMEPYKAYTADLAEKDIEGALKNIRKAYEQAEKTLPDSQQTGALAENYGDLIRDDASLQIEIYKRALELQNPEGERRVDLMSKLVRSYMYLEFPVKPRDVRRAQDDINRFEAAIIDAGLERSTYDAERLVVEAWADYYFKKPKSALAALDEAQLIFDSPSHTVFSPLKFQARLLKSDILSREDEPIEAALAAQTVMQNLEGELPADHSFIKRAFSRWLSARSKINDKGLTEQAMAEGVCKCWPYDEMSADAPLPLTRTPPVPPRSATRSGFVMMKFDIDREGKPYNIRATLGTDKKFIQPSTKAIEQWRYEVRDNHTEADLKGIAAQMTFKILNSRGKLIPEADLPVQVWDTEGG